MDAALAFAGLTMGLAASPHCAAMCGAPCAALTSGCRRSAGGFHFGRLIGYTAGGALAAGSIAILGAWTQAAPALRPFWMLLHLALLALGLWWLMTGRQPRRLMRDNTVPIRVVPRRPRPIRSTLAGLAWVAWPCGSLQAALLLAGLASNAQGGALVMFAFALGSMPGLALAPWAWARWNSISGRSTTSQQIARFGLRIAGLALVGTSGWSLTHGMWARIAAFCN